MKLKSVLLFSLLFGILCTGCQWNQTKESNPQLYKNYITGYSSGVIGQKEAIQVQFVMPMVDSSQLGKEVEGMITLRPSVKGKVYWENVNTLVFMPEQALKRGSRYTCQVQLDKLIPSVPKEIRQFVFAVDVMEQYFQLHMDGAVMLTGKDVGSPVQIHGMILTADVASDEEIEKALVLDASIQPKQVIWEHNKGGKEHPFIITQIQRPAEDKKYVFTLVKGGNNSGPNTKKEITIPGPGKFRILEFTEPEGEEQKMKIVFSDPLAADQNFQGLIRLDNGNVPLQLLAENNIITVYPGAKLTGNKVASVDANVSSIAPRSLGSPVNETIQFEQSNPEVKLLGGGFILPGKEKVHFPFLARNLHAIDVEIFKIYNNNVLDFLQEASFSEGSNYGLNRVGQVITFKEKLSLSNSASNSKDWEKYILDLTKIVQSDPAAIYQVRIGFRKDYVNYDCASSVVEEVEQTPNVNEDEGEEDDNGEIEAIPVEPELEDLPAEEIGRGHPMFEDYYGVYGYRSHYSWDNRENPCEYEYYHSDHFLKSYLFVSDLGMIAKSCKNQELHVACVGLLEGNPLSNVEVQAFNYQKQQVGKGNTNSDGFAVLHVSQKPYFITASHQKNTGILRLKESESLSTTMFDVGGGEVKRGIKTYIYGERGVWRPGDSIFLNLVLEDKDNPLPKEFPLMMEVFDPRGRLITTLTRSYQGNRIIPFYFKTSSESLTGNWNAKFRVGGAITQHRIRVETIKPNRLKIELNPITSQLKQGRLPNYHLSTKWLHGSIAGGLHTVIDGVIQDVPVQFSKYPDFSFHDITQSGSVQRSRWFDGNGEANGETEISPPVFEKNQPNGKWLVHLTSRVFERGGESSIDVSSQEFHYYSSYAGVSLPQSGWQGTQYKTGNVIPMQIASVLPDGGGNPRHDLTVNIYKLSWSWWWESERNGILNFNSSELQTAIHTESVTVDPLGRATLKYQPTEWGRYLVKVCDKNSGHCASKVFYVGNPWEDEGDGEGDNQMDAQVIHFSALKEMYKPGEEIKVKVPVPTSGRALITVENGSRILSKFWTTTEKGDRVISIPATKEMAPYSYINVHLVQPVQKKNNDAPIRLYGILPVHIDDQSAVLQPRIVTSKIWKPNQTVQVEISEKSNRSMEYTLDVVDEGLLSITRFKTPNPYDGLHIKEALGVKTWDLYQQVLQTHAGQFAQVISLGGDEAAKNPDAAKANRFKPVVMHLGPFTLKSGKAKHTIQVPNYFGQVRVMCVAVGDRAYGNAEEKVEVKSPLMILPTIPRVIGPGESFLLPVTIFATEPSIKKVKLSGKDAHQLVTISQPRDALQFAQPGEQDGFMMVEAGSRSGVSKLEVAAEGGGGSARQVIEIQVRNPNPFISYTQDAVIDGSKKGTLSTPSKSALDERELILELSSLPPLNLEKNLNYLIHYPYGCGEQTTSSGFPQLYLDKLTGLTEKQKIQVRNNVQATVQRLVRFQLPDGRFSIWEGGSYDSWITNYIGHFLCEAKSLGYSVPVRMWSAWIQGQNKMANLWSPVQQQYGLYTEQSKYDQAYRLYTLACAGQPNLAAMNKLKESKLQDSRVAHMLSAAYAVAGQINTAKKLIQGVSLTVAPYSETGYTYGSDLRDMAFMLISQLHAGNSTEMMQVLKSMSELMKTSERYNTQALACALSAVGQVVQKSSVSKGVHCIVEMPGKASVPVDIPEPMFLLKLDSKYSGGVNITNKSPGMIFSRIIERGRPVTPIVNRISQNIDCTIEYKSMNGTPISIQNLKSGTDFVAEIKVRHTGPQIAYQNMALTYVFPAGWEVQNVRMDQRGSGLVSSTYDYQDIRDDRISTFFSIEPGKMKVFKVLLQASYSGTYVLPPVVCEAMYDPGIKSVIPGGKVQVEL